MAKCQARATIRRDGSAHVGSGATDIGTGTYTVMSRLAAEVLGLTVDRVESSSAIPGPPGSGGRRIGSYRSARQRGP